MQFATPKFTSGKEWLSMPKKTEVIFYDFRFTDIKGMWHHVSYYVNSVTEETFNGIPFDGSSIARWQPINASDMQLHPEISTAFLDPFTADKTLVIFCDVWDIL